MTPMEEEKDKLTERLLLAAMLGGLLLAGLTTLPELQQPSNSDAVIVRVNERHIDRTEYARAYRALLDDKTNTINRRYVGASKIRHIRNARWSIPDKICVTPWRK